MKLTILHRIALALCLLLVKSAIASPNNLNAEEQVEVMGELIAFFDTHAFDPTTGTYYSELDNQGKLVSNKVYTVALSRLIYGLAYSSEFYPQNLKKAEDAAAFQLEYMLGEDEFGPYFLSWVETSGGAILDKDDSIQLDIWQQAYGLNGMVELYRQTKNESLLRTIRELHHSLIKRFRDPMQRGFYGEYSIETGPVVNSKSLQSLMYPVTAYLANLWLADEQNREAYEQLLEEHVTLLGNAGWDSKLQWVNVKFDKFWVPCEHGEDSVCSSVSPGHNFQLSALFLRASTWPFLSAQKRATLGALGMQIIEVTLDKPIYGEKGLQHGFAGAFNPLTSQVVDVRKAWWQHCEAIIALSLSGEYTEEREALLTFLFTHFHDNQYGGEFFFLDENNRPVTTELKGSIGKSAYHTVEMLRFLH